MTLVAIKSGVLAFEHISGFVVVERFCVPLNQREFFSVVFGMAFRALLAGTGREVIGGVQSALGRKAAGDFGVALQAFERRLSAKLVTAGTVGGSVQRLVRPRQWAGRNLGGNKGRKERNRSAAE